ISDAKRWAAHRPKNAPELTTLHLDFLRASEEAEEARTHRERAQIAEITAAQAARAEALSVATAAQNARARQQKRAAWALVGLATLLIAALVAAVAQLRSAFERQATAFAALSEAALKEGRYDSAARYAVAGLPGEGRLEGLIFPWLPHVETQLARA